MDIIRHSNFLMDYNGYMNDQSQVSPIQVKHTQGTYPICFASKLADLTVPTKEIVEKYDDFALVINEKVAHIYVEEIKSFVLGLEARETELEDRIILVRDGEENKSILAVQDLCGKLSEFGLSRQSCLIALGGGATTDLVGFASAVYMRGIDYIQVPTTLLAQVDASIGGKTGVNLSHGKNLVGAFHSPKAVMLSSAFLHQLPDVELACGFAEIIKHALIKDAGFFEILERAGSLTNLVRNKEGLRIVRRACQIKVDIVQTDEHEQGERALLNLGHTFAHALESMDGYTGLKHGQAVALGLMLAGRISCRLGDISEDDCRRIQDVLQKAGLPSSPNKDIDIDEILTFMMRDKKQHHKSVPLILLKSIGEAYISSPYGKEELRELIQEEL